ncbi:MAG: SDR family oxidoreductase [Alphaproteobacteria bacterium]|nr:SDR family oxidoreductase [Alphaproteobacteria bacterium]
MSLDPELEGQHALVTGGGTGLGLAMAKALCSAGAEVTVVGRRKDVLEDALQKLGPQARMLVGDIADLGQVGALAREAERAGPVSILVNNAGTHHKDDTLATSDADFRRVIDTNLTGTFALTREIARSMKARKSGSILVITSMAALVGILYVAAYTASKSGLQGLVRELAVEFGAFGVRVNALAPGFIETDMNRDIFKKDPERLDKVLARTPLRRLGTPEDIASAAVFLVSPKAAFITGACLPVDGGMSIGF